MSPRTATPRLALALLGALALSLPAPARSPAGVEYGHGIWIAGDDAFVAATRRTLDDLAQLPSGQRLLERLAASGFRTQLRFSQAPGAAQSALHQDPPQRTPTGELRWPASDSIVTWNPDADLPHWNDAVLLGHELIHGLHAQEGTLSADYVPFEEGDVRLEELRTIGIGDHGEPGLSENALRADWNERFPARPVSEGRLRHRFTWQDPASDYAQPLRARKRSMLLPIFAPADFDEDDFDEDDLAGDDLAEGRERRGLVQRLRGGAR